MPIYDKVLILRVIPTDQVIHISSLGRLLEILNDIMKETKGNQVVLKKVKSEMYPHLYEVHLQQSDKKERRELSCDGSTEEKNAKNWSTKISSLFNAVEALTEGVAEAVNELVDDFELLVESQLDTRVGREMSVDSPQDQKCSTDDAARCIQRAYKAHMQRKMHPPMDPNVQLIMAMGFDLKVETVEKILKERKGDVRRAVEAIMRMVKA